MKNIVISDLMPRGAVDIVIDYKNGNREYQNVKNTILKTGRQALVQCLVNEIGTEFNFYITRMLFGDGGTQNGVKRYVNSDRNGLFGVTRLSKPVMASIDPTVTTQAIFTSVMTFDDAVGVVFSEMALQMATGDLYSMTTFSDLTKTEEMQITFNWRISLV